VVPKAYDYLWVLNPEEMVKNRKCNFDCVAEIETRSEGLIFINNSILLSHHNQEIRLFSMDTGKKISKTV
jgi:hypothetical protein